MRGLGDGILLEGAVDGIAGHGCFGAEWLIALLAVIAGEAGAVDPFDSDVVTTESARLDDMDGGESQTEGTYISTSLTNSPLATTTPAPSWPPTRGSRVGRGQSPLTVVDVNIGCDGAKLVRKPHPRANRYGKHR